MVGEWGSGVGGSGSRVCQMEVEGPASARDVSGPTCSSTCVWMGRWREKIFGRARRSGGQHTGSGILRGWWMGTCVGGQRERERGQVTRLSLTRLSCTRLNFTPADHTADIASYILWIIENSDAYYSLSAQPPPSLLTTLSTSIGPFIHLCHVLDLLPHACVSSLTLCELDPPGF